MGLKEELGPLRSVLFEVNLPIEDPAKAGAEGRDYAERLYEVYECGHALPRKQDIYGPTNAERRRCRKCRDGEPVDERVKADVEAALARKKEETHGR